MMKIRRYIPVLAIVFAACILSGCKKDDDDTKDYLEGSLTLSMPKYVTKGFTKQFKIDTLATITAPDGSSVGYYFNNPVTKTRDTVLRRDGQYNPKYPDGIYHYTAGTEIGVEQLSLIAFSSKDYYTVTAPVDYNIVDPAMDGTGSLTGFKRSEQEYTFTDSRDGKQYWAIDIDGTSWMSQNLGWRGAGAPYYNSEVMANVLGQYYSWEAAQTACPEGWRLPSDEDVKALAIGLGATEDENGGFVGVAGDLMADLYFNGTSLWPYWPSVKIKNTVSLYLIPSGYAVMDGSMYLFSEMESYSVFWTSSEKDGRGVYRYIYEDQDILMYGLGSKKGFAAPIRCIK